jgi:DNA-binding MarR family transcriptional regulator
MRRPRVAAWEELMPKAAVVKAAETDAELLNLDGLTDLLGFHVRLAQSALYRDFAATLKELDLTQKLCAVLTLIKANPGTSQIALASTLGTDRATMMAIVDRLQDRHLLYRERSKSDRRRQELYLTDEGRATLSQALRLIAKHEARFKSRFTASELKSLVEMLGRIHEGHS